jgi:Restriction endonuclease
MQPADIERAIRQATYTAYFVGENGVGLHDVREMIKADEQLFEQAVADLYNRGLIHPHAAGWYYRITPHGIFSAEENGIVAADVTEINRDVRHRILVYLTETHEAERHHYGRAYEQIAVDLELDLSVVRPNLLLLTDIHYVQAPGSGAFRISGDGLQAVAEWRRKTAILQEFEALEKLKPLARGRAFQKLFARQVGAEGWVQEEGARTSNEEMDVVLHRNHTYYVVECKWESKPIGAPVIRELFGKLSNRTEVWGIAVSMSGFTAGAIKQVQDYTAQATILLFGPADTQSIFEFNNTFTTLLDQKLKEFVIRRRVAVK